MKKKLCITLFLFVATVVATGCGIVNNAGRVFGWADEQLPIGDTVGKIGETYKTSRFSFIVKSVTPLATYNGIPPEDGYTLYDVVIWEKNISDSPLPIYTGDFFMDHDSYIDYVYALDPESDAPAPEELTLGAGEETEYHLLFETPAVESGLMLMIELFNGDTMGATTFAINVN
ncbi:MAG: DUF4352 domain-containing protein [Clostridiales bacterium]|jgi:hypothetical protein|nr:DUF4352 domain-containing protein [Clostridiales bacterium]